MGAMEPAGLAKRLALLDWVTLRKQNNRRIVMGTKRKTFVFVLFCMVLAGAMAAGSGGAKDLNFPFPSYGSGAIEVRIYTDYFCPPCQAMEPGIEPILKDLLKKKTIRLTLVDVPFNKVTPLLARNFLYALKENNDLEHAFRVRNILLEAAIRENVTTQEQAETLLKAKGIPFKSFDVKPAFDRYNALIKEDKIEGTPACVIIKNGQKKAIGEGQNIINALKALS
jgi:thiol:disulfide interchange protein DsbA